MKSNFPDWTILRRFQKFAKKTNAFSLIEVLIASAIILTNLGVLSSALVQYGEVSKKQNVITLAMDLEAALHRAVTDPSRYNYGVGGTIDTMVAAGGDFPPSFSIVIPVDISGGVTNITLTWPATPPVATDIITLFLDKQMNICAAGNFTDKNCVLQFEIAKTKTGVSPIYSFAYRITINPELHIGVQSLGVNETGAFMTSRPPTNKSDYSLYIPQFILASENFTQCSDTTTAGLTGYDRITGSPICLLQPTNVAAERCDSNEITKGLLVQDDGTNFHLVPRCVTARGFTCPPPNSANDAGGVEYSMLIYDPKSIDPAHPFAPGDENKCVFTAMSPATDPTPPSNVGTTLNVAQACPANYYITTPNPYGCGAVGVGTATQGQCGWCAAYNPVAPYNCINYQTRFYNSEGFNVTGAPVMGGGFVVGANCTLSDATPFPPAAQPSCVDPITSPTVTGTVRLTSTCDLLPTIQMIVDATAE